MSTSFSLLFVLLTSSTVFGDTINNRMVNFLNGKLGVRIGGGECAHVPTEALRVAGGEFINIGADFPAAGDYVWGTFIKQISYNNRWVDSSPTTKVQPGDIIQYRNVTLVYPSAVANGAAVNGGNLGNVTSGGSSTSSAPHHTSVVATVNSAGMPTSVFEQNFSGVRTLAKHSIDLTKLKSGYVRIYRAKARTDGSGKYKFTIVNNTNSSRTVTVKNGTSYSSNINLGTANTETSFRSANYNWSNPSSKFSIVLSNNKSITVVNAAGYEIYTKSNGTIDIRTLSP